MRYPNGVKLRVPYIDTMEDGSTERCFAMFDFAGDVDRRRVKRELRKWVRSQLGRKLHPLEQQAIMQGAVDPTAVTGGRIRTALAA